MESPDENATLEFDGFAATNVYGLLLSRLARQSGSNRFLPAPAYD